MIAQFETSPESYCYKSSRERVKFRFVVPNIFDLDLGLRLTSGCRHSDEEDNYGIR